MQLTVFSYKRARFHVYEKLGFRREGVFREFIRRDGQLHDLILYGLLRRERGEREVAPQFPAAGTSRTGPRCARRWTSSRRRYDPLGIVASGTIVRGSPGPSSDLDLYVIHAAPWRQRVQRRFNGVRRRSSSTRRGRCGATSSPSGARAADHGAHAGEGVVVLDRDPVVEGPAARRPRGARPAARFRPRGRCASSAT